MLKRPISVQTFRTTGAAYDACQTGEAPVGAVLHIPTERVVGISDTWPLAVTVETGNLHGVKADFDIVRFRDESGFSGEDLLDAVATANELGYPVAEWATKTIEYDTINRPWSTHAIRQDENTDR